MEQKIFNEWLSERNRVVKSYDVDMFKAFYIKWQKRGVYSRLMPLPTDDIIEVSMRKMVYHMTNATEAEKAEAERWLLEHGSDTSI